MDILEQLRQDNDRLNSRLIKAAEIFKEQKAKIESLTEELNKAIDCCKKWETDYNDLNKLYCYRLKENDEMRNHLKALIKENEELKKNKIIKNNNHTNTNPMKRIGDEHVMGMNIGI